jgi:trimethyllysine dioxygenase
MTAPSIRELRPLPTDLDVTWDDGTTTTYPWIWLRDHAHDAATMHPVTQQRQLHTAALASDLRAASVGVHGDDLVVTWSIDDTSVLPVAFLARYRVAGTPRPTIDVEPVVWDAARIAAEWPAIDHHTVIAGDEGVGEWLATTARYGFSIVTGVPATLVAGEDLLRRIAYVRQTIFGGFWDFKADMSMADTAYTNLELLPHTDGTYSHDAPGLQLLLCLEFDGTGGESTMVDGLQIAALMRRDHPEHYATLSHVVVPGQYLGDDHHLIAARPVFRHDHTGHLAQVSFNNGDRAPFLLPRDEMHAFYDALRVFDALANDHANQWRRALQPGEAMLFDNWRVLHGRCAYTGHRHLCGGYINREEFESRLRVLTE